MNAPPFLTNSLLALEVTEYAKEKGKEEEFSRAVYQAYFQEGKNIGDLGEILPLAQQAGLDSQEVQAHLKEGTYSARIESSHQEARSLGVSGVPTFVVGPAKIIGAQAPDVFVSMLKRVTERGLA
jgi:predicted DsbA family dithiol-disulfide isomerase